MRVAFYIDGFNLYFGIKNKDWSNCLWLDLCSLCDKFLRPNQTRVLCKYFTARIRGSNAKQRRQNTYLKALNTLPDLDIYYGRYLLKTIDCNLCRGSYSKPEEKMTDVNIAVEMVKDAYEDNFDIAILLSADSDLVPPIQAIKALGKRVVVAFPPRNKSQQLRQYSNAHFSISRAKLYQSQFPDNLTASDGHLIQKPETWV